MKIRRRGATEGFTLLELLISLALLSLIVVIVGGSLRMGSRSAESGQRKIETLERFRTSLNIMESQLQSAYAVKRTGINYDDDFNQFVGDRSSMQFRSLYSLLGAAKGPVEVTYTVREDGGRKVIVGSEKLVVFDESLREIRLIDNASDIYFEYYDKGATDEKGEWTNEWSSKDSLPEKVRLVIDNDGRLFSLVVQLRTAARGGKSSESKRPGK
jgi:general secretion pathway protein J